MRLNPYLVFNGQCEEAFRFYAECLGGSIGAMLPFAGTPAEEHVPAEWRNKVMHARLDLGDQVLMGSDDMPGRYQQPASFSVALHYNNVEEAERAFARLAEGGRITMPLEKTFWAARFGMFTDRYGVPWMVNCEQAGG
jgi:PhnB protein